MTGCVSGPSPAATQEVDEQFAPASIPPEAVLVDRPAYFGIAYDILCREGGATTLKRLDDARVVEGHTKLIVSVHAPPTSTGVEVGYSIDGGAVVWLPTAFVEDTVHEVPVPAGSSEDEHLRWTFYLSQNVKPAPQDCYTGATLLQEEVRIVAR